jgi:hypothetical protein
VILCTDEIKKVKGSVPILQIIGRVLVFYFCSLEPAGSVKDVTATLHCKKLFGKLHQTYLVKSVGLKSPNNLVISTSVLVKFPEDYWYTTHSFLVKLVTKYFG